jgi:uncharacterized protein (DUF1778 family)
MKRTHRLELLLNDDERQFIARAAADTGLTMAAFARQAMMIDQPADARARAHIVDRAAVVALNHIGSNLNQIARVANATKAMSPQNMSALASLYKQLRSIVQQIERP